MNQLIESFIRDAGIVGVALIWGFLIFGPYYLFTRGLSVMRRANQSQQHNKRKGTFYMIGFGTSLLFIFWFLFSYGPILIQETVGAFVMATILLVALSISAVGFHVRQLVFGQRSRQSVLISLIGIVVTLGSVSLTFLYLHQKISVLFAGISFVAFILGFFGYALVPSAA
jgi:hypothetical protein